MRSSRENLAEYLLTQGKSDGIISWLLFSAKSVHFKHLFGKNDKDHNIDILCSKEFL